MTPGVEPWALRSAGGAAPASPGWATYVVAAALLAFLVAVVWCCLWSVVRSQSERDDTDEGDGGSGLRREPPRPPGPCDGDPAWWPEFEQQFARYVAERLTRVR